MSMMTELLSVEIADNVNVKVAKGMVADIAAK